MTFYLKYRPKTLDELDSENVRESLKKIVLSGTIPHAFLFSGPKGIGKTSAARILAKIINCDPPSPRLRKGKEPCNKCYQCTSIAKGNNLDVIEIDAASHRGIDDVRVLRDAVKLSAAKASKKVYIIDEAHMLTTEASNALLKTLEEPPDHVIFILATTNPEKLIDTIRSRTVNVRFDKATVEEICRSLKRVVKGEGIKIDEKSLLLIASLAEGSFRDAVKLLEQLTLEKIELKDAKEVEEFLFKKKVVDPTEFLGLLAQKDIKLVLLEIEKIVTSGTSIEKFIDVLLELLRKNLLAQVGIGKDTLESFDKDQTLSLIEALIGAKKDLPYAFFEQLPLEVVVIEWCSKDRQEQISENNKEEVVKTKKENISPLPQLGSKLVEISEDVWKSILAQVRLVNTSIEALLRAARPLNFDGRNLTLGVYYKFHKERLEDSNHKRILEDVVGKVLNNQVRVTCTLTQPPVKIERISEVVQDRQEPGSVLTETKDQDIIEVAKQIFGN